MPSDRSSIYVTRCTEKYIFFVRSLNYVLWNYILGELSHNEEKFKIQETIIRIIMNSSKNASCRQLSKDSNILPVQSQYIFSILLFVTKHKVQFLFNSQVHEIKTRQTSDLYLHIVNFWSVPTYSKLLICTYI